MSKLNLEFKFSSEKIHFPDALSFMEQRVNDIINGKASSLVWVLEHHPVYTAGISAKEEDLIAKTDIPIFQTNRGGKYTYHGPGMKIIYVLFDLKKLFHPEKPDVRRFVEFLENWVIRILAEYGVIGEIKPGRVGVWVNTPNGEKKIAAIGIKLRQWVSYHGIAINLNPDLSNFQTIIPCGIKNFGVTSLQELGANYTQNFEEVLRRTLQIKF